MAHFHCDHESNVDEMHSTQTVMKIKIGTHATHRSGKLYVQGKDELHGEQKPAGLNFWRHHLLTKLLGGKVARNVAAKNDKRRQ